MGVNTARQFLLATGLLALFAGMLWADVRAEQPAVRHGSYEHVKVIDFEGPIAGLLAAYVGRHVEAAQADGVDCLVLRIDSPGGTVLHSMEIGDLLVELADTIHVVAWIPKEAYSGAAFVALACDEIVMGPHAHMGDAQPGTMDPTNGGWRKAGEKMESPLRAKVRGYAQANGYPISLCESMVSEHIEVLRVRDPSGADHFVEGEDYRNADDDAELVPGFEKRQLKQVGSPVVNEGELLTMTSKEAAELGFLERTFTDGARFPASEDQLLAALGTEGGQVEKVGLTFSESASRRLLQIAGILSAIVALALIVTMWQGVGTMTIVGAIALVLTILINLTAEQVHGFPLFLVGLGVLLLAAEVFLIPGFGIAGVLGIASIGTGFLFLSGGVTLSDDHGLTKAFVVEYGLQFALTMLGGFGLLLLASRFLPNVGPGRRLMLAGPPVPPTSQREEPTAALRVGQRGRAVSPLRPAGAIDIDGRAVDVITDGSFVEAGAEVRITEIVGNHVVVRPVGTTEEEDA